MSKHSIEAVWFDPTVSLLAVLVGAILAWGTSYYFENRRLKQEIAAHAYSIFYKLGALLDDLAKLSAVVIAAQSRTEELDLEDGLWRVIYDSSGFPDQREGFSAAELSIITNRRGSEIAAGLMELENAHRIAMSTYRRIIALKYELHERIGSAEVAGRTVSYDKDTETQTELAPILINLRDNSNNLEEQLPGFLEQGKSIATEFCLHANGELKLRDFPLPNFDESLLTEFKDRGLGD